MAATDSRDVELRITAVTDGGKNVGQLADELDALSTTAGATGPKLKVLADDLRSMGQQQDLIDNWRKLKSESKPLADSLQQARDKAQALGRQLSQTTNPSRQLTQEFEKAKRAVKEAEAAYQKQQQALQQLRAEMGRNNLSTQDLAQKQVAIKRAMAEAAKEAERMKQALRDSGQASQDAGKQIQDANDHAGKSGHGLANIADEIKGKFGALAGIAATLFTGHEFIEANNQAQSFNRAMTFLTGSQEKAAEEMDFVRTACNSLGIEIDAASNAYLSLAASTKGTNLEGANTRLIFEGVAGAMAVLGKSSADTERALTAVAQMASKGTVSMHELKRQLGADLPGAMAAAARGTGLTVAELTKMVESGKVLAEDLLPKLSMELKRMYGVGTTENDSFVAQWNRMKNTITETFVAIGEGGAMKALSGATEGASAALLSATFAVEGTGKSLGTLIGSLANGDLSLKGFSKTAKTAFADVDKEIQDKMVKAALTNKAFAATLDEVGTMALQTAQKQKTLADITVDAAARASTAATPGWLKIGAAFNQVEKSAGDYLERMKHVAESRSTEASAMIAAASAFGTEKQQREAAVGAAQLQATALKTLAEAHTNEISVLQSELTAKEAEYASSFKLTAADQARAKSLQEKIELGRTVAADAEKEYIAASQMATKLGEVTFARAEALAAQKADLEAKEKAVHADEEALAALNKNSDAKQKELVALKESIALKGADAEKAVAAAAAARLQAEAAKEQAAAYGDNAKRVGELRQAYNDAKDAITALAETQKQHIEITEQLTAAKARATEIEQKFRQGLQAGQDVSQLGAALRDTRQEVERLSKAAQDTVVSTDQMTAATEKAAAAHKLYRDALHNATEATQRNVDAIGRKAGLTEKTLQLEREQYQTILDVAKARGDEEAATQATNNLRQLDIQILQAQAEAQRKEADAIMLVVAAKKAELIANDQLTPAKKAELDALEASAAAKKLDADRSDELASRMDQVAKAADATKAAAEGSAEGFLKMAGGAKTAADALQALAEKQAAVDKQKYAVDIEGKRIGVGQENQLSLAKQIQGYGVDQDRAWQVAGEFVDKNGIANPNMLKPGENLGVEVMKRAMEEIQRAKNTPKRINPDNTSIAPTEAVAPAPAPIIQKKEPIAPPVHRVEIVIGGKSAIIETTSDKSAQELIRIMQELKSRAH